MANFCSKCGKPVNSEAFFCSNCGANLQSFEVNNSVDNDNTDNNSQNTNFSSNNTASEQVINQNNVYQQISLSALLANLKEIPIGTKVKTGGYTSEKGKEMILDIALYVDIEQLKQNGNNLFVNLEHISGKTRRKLSDNFSNATDGYLDITVEGQIKKMLLFGNYLEAENLDFEHFTCDNENQVVEQVTSTNTQENVSINTSPNIISNNNLNQQIVSQNQVSNKSTKSRLVAALLELFLGWIGLGWFYLGDKIRGFYDIMFSIIALLFCGGYPIIFGCIFDCVEIMAKSNLKDGKGKIVD